MVQVCDSSTSSKTSKFDLYFGGGKVFDGKYVIMIQFINIVIHQQNVNMETCYLTHAA